MKRSFFYVLPFVILAFLMSSCRGRDGRDGLDGRDGIDGIITNRVVLDLEVNNTNTRVNNADYYTTWQQTTDGAYQAKFDIPEISNEAYNDGMIVCYAEMNTATDAAYQEQLPFTYFDEFTNSETGDVERWSRLLDFDVTVGQLNIYYTNSDFRYVDTEPGLWHFRLVMVW